MTGTDACGSGLSSEEELSLREEPAFFDEDDVCAGLTTLTYSLSELLRT